MKVRVKYYGGYFYPQVKGLLWWKDIYTQKNFEYNIAWFLSEEAARKFLETDFLYNDKVVWEGETKC